jgi:hypothetical protein
MGDRLAKIKTNCNGVRTTDSRWVLEVVDDLVIYTRKHPNKPCKCHLIEWRKWAKGTDPVCLPKDYGLARV